MTNYIGIDISKRDFHVALSEDMEVIKIINDRSGIKEFIAHLKKSKFKPSETIIGMESTGSYHLLPAIVCSKAGYQVNVINPLITKKQNQTSLRRVKNDTKDARLIRYCTVNGAGYAFSETGETLTLKTLTRQRNYIVDMRRRLKLKQQNVDLQEKLQQMPALGEACEGRTPQAGYSWEEHKQQLLSEMGGGEDDQFEPWDKEQLSIADEAIRRTDEVVARMEVQIDQLRTQLDEQQQLAAQAAQAPRCPPPQDTSVVDDDELIQRERATLRALQEEWTEKLRRAEVEIAVERAQNARQQTELDEKMRDLQAELDRIKSRGENDGDESVQSRLMKRLGLGSKK